MELAVRTGSDRFVPPGAYRSLEARLRQQQKDLGEIGAVVLSAFDRRTRLLPFVLYDRRMFPSGATSIAGALYQAGFTRTRAVFELWNPNFRPSRARINGSVPQMLLISSMQIHSRRAYDAIREAWTMGAERPLIVVGGPKAVYEPEHLWSIRSTHGPVAPDVAVTGESYVLLELLNVVLQHRGRRETMRSAFERARREGALEAVPGLVYLAPDATLHEPVLVDMCELQISPMAMMMFHGGQPYYTSESLYGLYNQVEFLWRAGAVSVQVTAHIPAVGTREYEKTYSTGRVIERIGRYKISDWMIDGNHAVVSGGESTWKRQLKLLGGYAAFYNLWNLISCLRDDNSSLRRKRVHYQMAGFMAVIWTGLKTLPYIARLITGRMTCYKTPPPQRPLPVRSPIAAFPRFPGTDSVTP